MPRLDFPAVGLFDQPAVRAFLAAVRAAGWLNPIDSQEVILGNEAAVAVAELHPRVWGHNVVVIRTIRTFPPRGHGAGSRALALLITLADRHGVTLTLAPHRFGIGGLSDRALVAWYRRHGFVRRIDGYYRPPL